MTLAYSLVILMVIIGLTPIAWEIKQNKFDFFNLKNPFILYFIIQLGASGLITFSTRQASEIGLDPIVFYEKYLEALILSTIALLLFQLGYYSRRRNTLVLPNFILRPWSRTRHLTITLVSFMLGFLAFGLLLAVNGGLSQFLLERENFRAGGLIGQGIFIFPATSMMSTAALIYFLGRVRANPRRSPFLPVVILFISVIPAYFIGFRSAIALPVLQFMVVWRYGYRHIPSGKLVSLLVFIVVGYTVYGFSREIPPGVSVDKTLAFELLTEKPELAFSVFARSKGTEVVASVINKLEQTGEYELGWRGAIEAATILIPKIIWEEKPMPSSQRFTTYFFGKNLAESRGYDLEVWGGISATVVGELYWHFGFFGVLIGLFFLGRIANAAYSTLQKNLSSPSVIIIYAITFTTFAMFAEAIQGYFNSFVMYAVLFVLIFSYLNLRKRRAYLSVKFGGVGSTVNA
jgi:hypothetical protein